jgi:hypothetical protein
MKFISNKLQYITYIYYISLLYATYSVSYIPLLCTASIWRAQVLFDALFSHVVIPLKIIFLKNSMYVFSEVGPFLLEFYFLDTQNLIFFVHGVVLFA